MTLRMRIGLLAALWIVQSGSANAQGTTVRPVIGGLPAGSGFSLGVELFRPRLAGPMDGRIRTIGSVKRYRQVEASLEAPGLGASPFFLELSGRYRHYPREGFWGLGPDTPKGDRSNYLLEDVDAGATVGAVLLPGLRVGASGGLLYIHTGRGRDIAFPSIEERFAEAEAPAVDKAPDYRRGGLFVEYDSRREPEDPRSGGLYALRWTSYTDRDLNAFSFRELDFEIRQFLPVGENDRIGLRLRARRTDPAPGHRVPFFLQPSVGGIDSVRGFHQYRFRDRNAVVVNGEYRRPVTRFLHAVAFADLGRAFPERGERSDRRTHVAGGLGTRVKLGRNVVFGVDLAFSGEGAQVWFRSDHTY